MATSEFFPYRSASNRDISTSSKDGSAVPWYIWVGLIGVTCSAVGGAWDVAWHRSIGRDTFWTPAHIMIQACAVLAAIVGVTLVIQATLNLNPKIRSESVNILGLRAPLGVMLAGWGGLAMLTSAPFDDWWHNAYGLDVKIISPPHVLLLIGVRAVAFGIMFLILAEMNRAENSQSPKFSILRTLFLYSGGLAVMSQMFFLQAQTSDVDLHRAAPYAVLAMGMPILFAAISEASRFRWAATSTAAVYTVLLIVEILIFPLFPAHPKLGPVFYPVTHLVPAKFPILILVPALCFDLLRVRTQQWSTWKVAIAAGFVFVAALVFVEWPFANFLMSKAAENRVFGTIYFDFGERANSFNRLRQFAHPEHGFHFLKGCLWAWLYAALSTFFGIKAGRWMAGVQR